MKICLNAIILLLASSILLTSGSETVSAAQENDSLPSESENGANTVEAEEHPSEEANGLSGNSESSIDNAVEGASGVDTSDNNEEVGKSDSINEGNEDSNETAEVKNPEAPTPPQSGPFIDLFGDSLLSIKMEEGSNRAELDVHLTNEALKGKKVIGLYFSADWCRPCVQFTPELVAFYNKMNARKGREDQFEIVWISRCKDFESWGQYFTHMTWLAMQPEDAMGAKGQMLSDKYKVKGIPTLVLLDEDGNVITTDGRQKIPADKAGIGFPWRNPLSTAYINLIPRGVRLLLKTQVELVKVRVTMMIKGMIGVKGTA